MKTTYEIPILASQSFIGTQPLSLMLFFFFTAAWAFGLQS